MTAIAGQSSPSSIVWMCVRVCSLLVINIILIFMKSKFKVNDKHRECLDSEIRKLSKTQRPKPNPNAHVLFLHSIQRKSTAWLLLSSLTCVCPYNDLFRLSKSFWVWIIFYAYMSIINSLNFVLNHVLLVRFCESFEVFASLNTQFLFSFRWEGNSPLSALFSFSPFCVNLDVRIFKISNFRRKWEKEIMSA